MGASGQRKWGERETRTGASPGDGEAQREGGEEEPSRAAETSAPFGRSHTHTGGFQQPAERESCRRSARAPRADQRAAAGAAGWAAERRQKEGDSFRSQPLLQGDRFLAGNFSQHLSRSQSRHSSLSLSFAVTEHACRYRGAANFWKRSLTPRGVGQRAAGLRCAQRSARAAAAAGPGPEARGGGGRTCPARGPGAHRRAPRRAGQRASAALTRGTHRAAAGRRGPARAAAGAAAAAPAPPPRSGGRRTPSVALRRRRLRRRGCRCRCRAGGGGGGRCRGTASRRQRARGWAGLVRGPGRPSRPGGSEAPAHVKPSQHLRPPRAQVSGQHALLREPEPLSKPPRPGRGARSRAAPSPYRPAGRRALPF